MFHSRVTASTEARSMSAGELALREFLSHHDEALGHTAVLLADRRGARLLNGIRDGLEQPGSITHGLRRLLLQLRAILLLEQAHEEEWEAEGCVALLEPEDPIVPELCLFADGLDDVLRGAGIAPTEEKRII
ncbi:hypothetical protein SAMN05444007_101495 [Cribrihabitans marinus]|uniref:Uncharacterized protein n=1 Tax=Cribrihabitans marinus TaxID=1227549 RepID=A0A1H6RDK9_9RHOB|nr:hypothetical protein [Cribrihabitans marinus]GGH21020.1 hypothetical protein GCM10010973_05370 [Cribrihabitans marinus]SEI53909.1 hypothetical protein SAMN05444007_101495 [Cribrihabitans marinus]